MVKDSKLIRLDVIGLSMGKNLLYESKHALTFLIKIFPRVHNTQLNNPNPCDRIHDIKSIAIFINCILQFQKLLHAHNTQMSNSNPYDRTETEKASP
jgi:hypothetical protein